MDVGYACDTLLFSSAVASIPDCIEHPAMDGLPLLELYAHLLELPGNHTWSITLTIIHLVSESGLRWLPLVQKDIEGIGMISV